MSKKLDFSKAKQGPIIKPSSGKTRITIRIDDDILDWFRGRVEGGGNYQSLINKVLKEYVLEQNLEKESDLKDFIKKEFQDYYDKICIKLSDSEN